MKYRYHLLKYSTKASRLTCPQCGRPHCFSPYVDDNEQIYGPEYGRCNHESSCGYQKYPPSDYDPTKRKSNPDEDWRKAPAWLKKSQAKAKASAVKVPEPVAVPEEGLCTLPAQLVNKTVRLNPLSDFLKFLTTVASTEDIIRVVQDYHLGVTKDRDVVFYQIDRQNRCRTGKIMKYNPATGHRIKDESGGSAINWVHSKLKRSGTLPESWTLTQCLFGEHLLSVYPDKTVVLVEAEKTAVIGAALVPQCVWLATGGKGQMNDRVEVLAGRDILAVPDIDGYDKWVEKAAERPHLNIKVTDLIKRMALQGDADAKIDIADVIIRWRTNGKDYFPLTPDQIHPPEVVSMNPVFLEVKKYFSPEYHENILALIEELDLEFVGVTRHIPIEDLPQ